MACLPRIQFEHPPGATPDAAIIWLHGLGADGSDFAGIVPQLGLPASLAIHFVFPHAPSIPVTINNGYVMPAWYDIVEMNVGRRVDVAQLEASARQVHKLIDEQLERGIPSERIILGGFSQGGAVVLQAALTYPQPLAGLMSLSSYFASAETIQPHPANRSIPIAIFHGTHDQVVPEALGRRCQEQLQAMGYEPEYTTYRMEHSVCPEEIQAIAQWISRRLEPTQSLAARDDSTP